MFFGKRHVMSRTPAYRIVYSDLRQQIRDKILPPGSFIPTENALCEKYSVSKTTVRKAISLLVQEGYVQVTQGRGTEVVDRTTVQFLNSVSSFTETLIAKGYDVSTQSAYVELTYSDARISSALGISEGSLVYHVQRVQCANEKPIAIMENYLVGEMFPGFSTGKPDFISLYSFLEHEYMLKITKADETLTAAIASFLEAQILDIYPGAPLMVSSRVTWCDKGRFDFSVLKIRGDKYSYTIHLSGR